MKVPIINNHTDTNKTNLRLLFTGTILAVFFGYMQLNEPITMALGKAPYLVGLAVLGWSALMSFFYVLAVAAEVKYVRKGRVDDFVLGPRHRAMFYDSAVDAFEFVPFTLLFMYYSEQNGYILGAIYTFLTTFAFVLIMRILPIIWEFLEKKK